MNRSSERDDKLEIIRGLILEEEAVGETVVFRITVLQSVVGYENASLEGGCSLKDAVIKQLVDKHPFGPRTRSLFNEGFFQFSDQNQHVGCYYIRETPFRWDYVDPRGKSIDSISVKRVDPSSRVRIGISFQENKVVSTFFGGADTLVFRARDIVCDAIRKLVTNSVRQDIEFEPHSMRRMLERFGRNVDLINIDPRDNQKFSKIVEEKVNGKPEVKKVIVYDVFNVRMTGIRIAISPEVARLIEQEGIRVTEIRGRLLLETGIPVTVRIKANGRVEFIISSKHFVDDEEKIYEMVVNAYQGLIPDRSEPQKGPLDHFMPGGVDA